MSGLHLQCPHRCQGAEPLFVALEKHEVGDRAEYVGLVHFNCAARHVAEVTSIAAR